MAERIISLFGEQVLRLVHHEFRGLTQAEAAQELGVSQAYIAQTLAELEKVAPSMFPILTKDQFEVYSLINERGLTHKQAGEVTGRSENAVKAMVTRIKHKGFSFNAKSKTIRLEGYMDGDVKQKF